jgi:DNA-binding transcriptional LysR family regulator
MDLQRLRYFVAVAEELHFSRAAQRLYLDQGALSASIRRLERDLGVRLFDRTSRRVELTAVGAALLPKARDLVGRADQLLVTARSYHDERRNSLRVGLFFDRFSAATLTEPILVTFKRRNPNVTVELVSLDLLSQQTAIRDGLVEVAIVRLPFQDPCASVTPLFEEPRVAICSPTAPWADAERLARHELPLLRDCVFPAPAPTPPDQPRDFEDFWSLGDQWDVSDLATAQVGAGIADLITHLSTPRSAMITAASWPPAFIPTLPVVVLDDVPGSRVAVVASAGDRSAEADSFIQCAREVTDQLIGLVPLAEVLR